MPPDASITARRLRHAEGYLALGMVNEASDELEAIEGDARLSDEVLKLRSDLYLQAKQWELLVAVARELARRDPDYEKGWIDWAYALREMNRIADAKAVLLEAEPGHGKKSGVLHYNLACYHSLLGELEEAKARLRRACQIEAGLKAGARDDPDLKALRASWDPAQLES
jgi:tetratricopeptide (TPR) repeat protein